MKITKGDKTIVIPGWTLLIGALVVDNIVANICKTASYRKFLKVNKKEDES